LNGFDKADLTEDNIKKLQDNDFFIDVKPKYKTNNKQYFLILLDI
jgi:hypothetical protein